MIFNDQQLDMLSMIDEGTKEERLHTVSRKAAACQDCRYYKNRKRSVFGSGSPDSKMMVLAEAPGRWENEKGYPFAGKSGGVLDKILAALDMNRKNVYICNVIKCWPGDGNPDPTMTCIKSCRHYLVNQIEIIQPKVIVAAGNYALKGLFGHNFSGIVKETGVVHSYGNISVVPVIHPAAFLRSKEAGVLKEWKLKTWAAWKIARDIAIS